MAEYKHFDVQHLDGVALFLLLEPRLLRAELLNSLRDELLKYIEDDQPDKLLVFFGKVEYCTSAAISSLLSVKRRLSVYGGDVKICGLSELVRESFDRLGLSGKVFEVYDSITEAVDSFS